MNAGEERNNKDNNPNDPPKGNLKTCPEDDESKVAEETKIEKTNVSPEKKQPFTPSILRSPSVAGSSYSKLFVSITIKFNYRNEFLTFMATLLFYKQNTGIKSPATKTLMNPYARRMTFSSAMVPKTTNHTAGYTPYLMHHLPARKQVTYSSTGKTRRSVSNQPLVAQSEVHSANKLFYDIGPDGIAIFYTARGYPQGPHGYWAPTIKGVCEALTNEHSRWAEMVARLGISSVLPLLDKMTGQARKFHFANGTKVMDIKAIVYIFDDIQDCNEHALDSICTNLVTEFNSKFDIRITFGGNAVRFGGTTKECLADIFLLEDVINLAMMSYLDAIQDGTFFNDTELVASYFGTANDNVFDLFREYLPE